MLFGLPQVIGWMQRYKYFVLFPVSIAEGPIISVIAGFLISIHMMQFWIAYPVLILGDIVGDSIIYVIGRYGGRRVFKNKIAGVPEHRMQQIDRLFQQHPGKTLLFGKLTHSFGYVILLTAGYVKQRFDLFVIYNLIGTIIKTLAFVLIGLYFGKSYLIINNYLNYALIGMGIIVALIIAMYFYAPKIMDNYLKKQ